MNVVPIKTRIVSPPKDDLFGVLREALTDVPEKSIVAITSKIVAICEGRCVVQSEVEKDDIIIKEADQYLSRKEVPGEWVMHTIKNNLFIPSAGVDASNGGDYFVLWPKDSKKTALEIYHWIQTTFNIKEFGVVITDSHTIPMRRGTMGISLAHAGFRPMNDYRGTKDLFGNKMYITLTDVADGLSAAAVLVMGEGNESTPLALITDVPFVAFGHFEPLANDPITRFEIPPEEDLYAPLFKKALWRKGGGGVD